MAPDSDVPPRSPGSRWPSGELTSPVSLTGDDGTLNVKAIGWSRHPLIDTSAIGRPTREGSPVTSWGRNKRWEYWNITSPTHILALTVSSLDYAAVHEVWVFDRATEQSWGASPTVVPARDVELPASLGTGPARARAKGVQIDIDPRANGGARLRAAIPGVSFDVVVERPLGHECLAVVVPWSRTRFQYTVKDVALPAAGTVTIDGVTTSLPAEESWAVLDHGRGRWPYDVRWNWGAGSGVSNGRVIGVQLGGRWTDGTGATENGLVVDGRLHKISAELSWEYDLADWRSPWRVTGDGLTASFVPFFDKRSASSLGIVASRTDQCFGHWSGVLATPAGRIEFDDILGWAEDVHNRW